MGASGVYLGGVQWLIYVTAFRRMFPAMDKFANQARERSTCIIRAYIPTI